jgi:hypothetical protein
MCKPLGFGAHVCLPSFTGVQIHLFRNGLIITAPNWEPTCVGAQGSLPPSKALTHPLVREGLEQLLKWESVGDGAQGCLPHAQVQTQPVVREG